MPDEEIEEPPPTPGDPPPPVIGIEPPTGYPPPGTPPPEYPGQYAKNIVIAERRARRVWVLGEIAKARALAGLDPLPIRVVEEEGMPDEPTTTTPGPTAPTAPNPPSRPNPDPSPGPSGPPTMPPTKRG